tara:strand:- start:558 stop:1352 length:795 start_codon:yes stop_codon:yes gene_type:complete
MAFKQKMPDKLEIFDANMHATVDGSFKDYKENMPSTISNYKNNFPEEFKLEGFLHVGLPNIGKYSHKAFQKISIPENSYRFLAVDKDGEYINFLDNAENIGVKLHPRLIGLKDFNKIAYQAINNCKVKRKIFGICSYFGDKKISIDRLLEFCKIIEYAIVNDVKIILFHGGGLNFEDLFEIYQNNNNVFFDTSFSILRYKDHGFVKTISSALSLDSRNIGFGSDFPDFSISDHINVISELRKNLDIEVLRRFLKVNTKSFLCQS